MGWSGRQVGLGLVMVTTGSINTLSTKWADTMQSNNSKGDMHSFNHPFFQADGMFIGEMLCMVAFYIATRIGMRNRNEDLAELSIQERTDFPKWIFFLPAICDMTSTCTMYLGLTLTYASSFQMLRGSVIIFTGLFSTLFLGRKLKYYQWLGMLFVIAGLVIVGLSDFLGGNSKDNVDLKGVIIGDVLIIVAQVVTAIQMVIEEKFITKYNVPPLLVVGWEGLFGFLTLTTLLVPFYWLPVGQFSGNPRGVLEDVVDAVIQLNNNKLLIAAMAGNILSIAFFNYAGVSVTKELSATTRMVLDSVRTLFIWIFSLAIGWQQFQYLQPIGFVILVVGMMLYNDLVILPLIRHFACIRRGQDQTPLYNDESRPVIIIFEQIPLLNIL
ncbi:unnamed protein product [Meganyctiphanes norvegica]|uniref:Solute carrier family 35 member F6 n=1 Tax=Meganyctiphanes norvegica TaxID=48144 RepID=A0AAV2RF40_MEGNR